MATVTEGKLIDQMGLRARPAAEAFIGIRGLLRDVIPAMQGVTEVPAVVDDSGPIPFTAERWAAFLALCQQLYAGTTSPGMTYVLGALRVQPDNVIGAWYQVALVADADPARRVYLSYVRPLALYLRRWRYKANDFQRNLGYLLAGLADADLIDEGRGAEGLAPVPVAVVKGLVQFMQAMTAADVNGEAAGLAIDAACGDIPLVVE
jgi:hypothetical protein